METVQKHLEAMQNSDQSFIWPSDTLFRYFRIMEAMMDNLKEREIIMLALKDMLMAIHDN